MITGDAWRQLLKLVQDVSAFFSITINTFLIYVILTKSPKKLGAYKYLMIFISLFEIAYSILDVVLVPQHYSHGPTFLVIVGVENKLFDIQGLYILTAVYWGFFGASMAVFAVHFIYRWSVVSKNRVLNSFKGWRIALWLLVPLGYGLTWVFTGYVLCAPNAATTEFIKPGIKELFGMEYGEYIYLGPYLYERGADGSLQLHVVPFIGLGIISATIVSSIIIVLVFGILCYVYISRLVALSTSSVKIGKLQSQLFYALVFQTTIPFVLMHIPAAIMFAFVFLDIDLGVYSALVSMTIAIYPAADPIPTLLIVDNYRKFLLGLLSCKRRGSNHEQPASTEMRMVPTITPHITT